MSSSVEDDGRIRWHNCTLYIILALVEAHYTSLPHAMAQLGWGPGIAILVVSWLMIEYIGWKVMEIQPQKLVAQYLDHLKDCPKLKLFILVFQLTGDVGRNIIYMVMGGASLNKFKDMVCPTCNHHIKFSYFIIIFASLVLLYVLASYYFNSVMAPYLAYATLLICFSCWAIVLFSLVYTGVKADVDYSYKGSTMLSFFSGLGGVAFVFADPGVLLDIQARDNNEARDNVPSEKMMRRGVVVVHVVVALCYFPIALVGYYVFGNAVDEDIHITLNKPVWLITMANLLVVIQVIQTYQIYALQVLDLIKALMKKETSPVLDFFILAIYVLVTMVVAIAVPFFGDLRGFFGGFKYILPCVMWLAIKRPKKFSFHWIANWICIIFGVIVMILALVGSLYKFIMSANSYKFFA